MKNFFYLFAVLVCSNFSYGQSLTLSKDTACIGESINATAHAPEYTLSTPAGTNNQNGYMFDVTATFNATITGFEISPVSAGATYFLWYRTGSFVGFENSSAGWTFVDSVTNVPTGAFTNPGFNINQPIVAGQTLAFYITSNGTNYTHYNNGTMVGNTLASDAYLTVKEGVGKAYPFGSTFTVRNFYGSVLYEPGVSSYTWSTGQSTKSVSITPMRSEILSCKMDLADGGSEEGYAFLPGVDLIVNATANPANIQSGQSSTLSVAASVNAGIAPDVEPTNNHNGAMFDVSTTDSATITGFTVSSTGDTGTADIEVFYKAGTHVGFEGNSGAWTSIGTYSVPEGEGRYLALNTPLNIIPGQTLGFYITSTNSKSLRYINGTGVGNVAASAHGLQLHEGVGVVYPFGTTFTPRMLATIVHFTAKISSGLTYNWSSGGSSGSVLVSPTSTTNYTVDVSLDGCTVTGNVTVTVGNVDLEEYALVHYEVFPNPASDRLVIRFLKDHKNTRLEMTNLTGQLVFGENVLSDTEEYIIPVSNMAKGLYLLKVEQEEATVIYKIDVQ